MIWTDGRGDRAAAEAIRVAVFVEEQGYALSDELVPEEDDNALHLTAFDGDTPVGVGRLMPYIHPNAFKAGRIAVLPAYRGKGYGRALADALWNKTRELGGESLYLDAQLYAVPFYEKCGFYRVSVVHPDCGEPHVMMQKTPYLENDRWLSPGKGHEAVICRFDLDFPAEIERASADILTLGFTEAYLNGSLLSEDLYAPAWTNYVKQDNSRIAFATDDVFSHRAYFLRLDLTAAAKPGRNALALHVGDGWFGQWECENEHFRPYGEKTVCWHITVKTKDGKTREYSSSGGGYFRPSFVTKTSMYFGETQDLRQMGDSPFTEDPTGGGYAPLKEVERPYTLLEPQTCPPDRILRRVEDPKVIWRFGDRVIYDLGENLAGFALLRFGKGARKNERVQVRYAEHLNEDGSLNFHSVGGTHRLSVDTFINCGGEAGERALLYPRFLWHAGRYVEVTGYHEFVSFCLAATDVPVSAEFRCSDPLLNWFFDAYVRTQRDNIHCAVPSDCPHRERLGYTGDGQLCAPAVMTLFDARGLYKKWMRDIADCQDLTGGHVQYTAPFYGGGGGPGGWGCAVAEIPYQYWKFYGDETVLREYYPHMLRYLDYLAQKSDGHIVTRAEENGWCLGDWCTPHNNRLGIPIPEPFVNTYFYIRTLRRVGEIAAALGKTADEARLKETETAVTKTFLDAFWNRETGSFCGEVNGADAFALDLGLGDERTLRNLVRHYRELGCFDTGMFGTPLVLGALFSHGYGDDALRLWTNRGEVSFYRMMESGATTLWEEWFNEHSANHPMFGASAEFLFKYILGIRQPEGGAGFHEIAVDPVYAPALDWAEGSVILGGKRITVRVEHGRLVSKKVEAINA